MPSNILICCECSFSTDTFRVLEQHYISDVHRLSCKHCDPTFCQRRQVTAQFRTAQFTSTEIQTEKPSQPPSQPKACSLPRSPEAPWQPRPFQSEWSSREGSGVLPTDVRIARTTELCPHPLRWWAASHSCTFLFPSYPCGIGNCWSCHNREGVLILLPYKNRGIKDEWTWQWPIWLVHVSPVFLLCVPTLLSLEPLSFSSV